MLLSTYCKGDRALPGAGILFSIVQQNIDNDHNEAQITIVESQIVDGELESEVS